MKLRVGCVLVVIDSISLSSLCGRTAILGHLWPFPTARTRWAERAFCSQRRRPATEVKVRAHGAVEQFRCCSRFDHWESPLSPSHASCRHALAAYCDCCSVLEPASPQVERVKRAPSKGGCSIPAGLFSYTDTHSLHSLVRSSLFVAPLCGVSKARGRRELNVGQREAIESAVPSVIEN